MSRRAIFNCIVAALLCACSEQERETGVTEPGADRAAPKQPAVIAFERTYQEAVELDLDGDGAKDRLILASNVSLKDGRPLWEDGHRWGVYVSSQGVETPLYEGFVANGFVRVEALDDSPGDETVLVIRVVAPQAESKALIYRGVGKVEPASAVGETTVLLTAKA